MFIMIYMYINGWYLKQLSIKTFLLNALIVVVWHLEHLISFYVIQVTLSIEGKWDKMWRFPTNNHWYDIIILWNILEIFPTKFYLDWGVSWDGVTAGINHSLAVSVVRSVADLRGTIRTIRWNSTFLSVSDRSLFWLDLLKFIMPLKKGNISEIILSFPTFKLPLPSTTIYCSRNWGELVVLLPIFPPCHISDHTPLCTQWCTCCPGRLYSLDSSCWNIYLITQQTCQMSYSCLSLQTGNCAWKCSEQAGGGRYSDWGEPDTPGETCREGREEMWPSWVDGRQEV